MSRQRQPARLWWREQKQTWYIKHGAKCISTRCGEREAGRAEELLAEYIASQYRPVRSGDSSEVTIGDILLVYLEEKADGTARPKETISQIGRLNNYFGAMKVRDIKSKVCREFAEFRQTESGARRDLETLRAAINSYHADEPLDVLPKVTLPEKSLPRQRWLTRQEMAKLIRAARKDRHHAHIVRLLMIGLYTGTRPGAVLTLQWMPSTTGGYVDIERGIIYRKGDLERVAHNKRKTPVKVAPRLLRFLKYWKANDQGLRSVVHFDGHQIKRADKAFRHVRDLAGLGKDVTPHVLRHTRATWLAHAKVNRHQAADSLGMTVEQYEATYCHGSPDFQEEAANAF